MGQDTAITARSRRAEQGKSTLQIAVTQDELLIQGGLSLDDVSSAGRARGAPAGVGKREPAGLGSLQDGLIFLARNDDVQTNLGVLEANIVGRQDLLHLDTTG